MQTNKNTLSSIVTIISSHHFFILSIFLICAFILSWQVRYFRIETSADTLLMKDNKHYIETQIVKQRFSPQEFLLIVYKPKKHELFSQKTFDDLENIRQNLLQIERIESVRSILNVPLFLNSEQFSSQTESSDLTIKNNDYSFEELKKAFAGHPIYEDLLINKEQTATALQILFKTDKNFKQIEDKIIDIQRKTLSKKLTNKEEKELLSLKKQATPISQQIDKIRIQEVEKIQKILNNYQNSADFYFGGVHIFAYQFIKIITNDLIIFSLAIGIMISLLLFIIFRKVHWVIIPLICCAYSILCTIGLFGFLRFNITVISANFISLQLILTLAMVLHFIVQYRQLCRQYPNWEQLALVKETLLRKIKPCFYAGITTIMGFGSLIFSGLRPVIDFGWMMIIAMFFSTMVTLLLFPALIMLFKKENVTNHELFSLSIINFFQKSVAKHALMVVIISILLCALSVGGFFMLQVENSFINYFRSSTRVHKELSFIDQHFGGSTPLDLAYTITKPKSTEDIILTAATVQELQQIQQIFKKYEATGKVLSIVNLTELASQVNEGKPLTEYELTALYWTMEDSLRKDLLGSFFSPENSQVLFSLRIKDTTKNLNRAKLIAEIKNDLKNLNIPESRYSLSNLFIMYQDILSQLFRSQILTMGLVSAMLMITFLFIFKSWKVALIGCVPNSISIAAILGFMGLVGIPLDLMTITIAAIAMGIAVDDTIYYIHCYLDKLKTSSAAESIDHCYATVGYAILYTSVIIILGFSQLVFSDFIPSVLFGLLTGLAMLMSLISNLTLLPIMLKYLVKQVS